MSSIIYKYKIYCSTDGRFEYIWDTVAPTVCPVNSAHTVNSSSSVHKIRSINVYKEENTNLKADGNNFYRLTASTNLVFTLPSTTVSQDRIIIVQRLLTNANTMTLVVSNAGLETINGAGTTIALTTNKQTRKLKAVGSNWQLLPVSSDDGEDKNLLEGNLLRDSDNVDPNNSTYYLGWSNTDKKYTPRQVDYTELGGSLTGLISLENLSNVAASVNPGNNNRFLGWNTATSRWIDKQPLISHINATSGHIPIGNDIAGMNEIKYNTTTVAPTINNDASQGYSVYSRWVNISLNREYICTNATVGAAVWIETTQSGLTNLIAGNGIIIVGTTISANLKTNGGITIESSQIALNLSATNITGTLAAFKGGTGLTSYTIGDLIYASGSTTLSRLSDVVQGSVLLSGGLGAAPTYGKVDLSTHITGTLPVSNGGLNISTYTTGDMLYASGTTVISKLSSVASGNVLISNGVSTAPSWGKVNLATHMTGILPPAQGGTGNAAYTIGDILYASSTTTLNKLSTPIVGNVLISNGIAAAPSYGKVNLTQHVTGTLPAISGGSGQSTYTTGDMLYASNSTTLSKLAAAVSGNVLISNGIGIASSWGKVGLATHTDGILPVSSGGTNISTYTTGDLLYASNATTLARLADIATGNVLISGGVGTIPSYGKVNLTQHVTATLPVANGGLGTNSLTANGIVIGQGTSAVTTLKSEFNKTTMPLLTDDASLGYSVGSRWIDTTNDKEFVCLDSTINTAVWRETSGASSANGVFSTVFEFRTDTITPAVGQLVFLNAGNVNQTSITSATKIRFNKKDYNKLDFLAASGLTNEELIIRRQGTGIASADSVHQTTLANITTDMTTYWELSNITNCIATGTALTNKELVVFDYRPVTQLDTLKDVTIISPQVNDTLRYNGSQWINTNNSEYVVWIFTDTKLAGTVGGTATTQTWTTRTLNTTNTNAGPEAVLAANQLTLGAGNWIFEIYSLFNNTDETKIRLYNVTDATTVLTSINNTVTTNNFATIQAAVVLAGSKTFEIQYYVTTTNSNTDLGMPSGIDSEIYTQVKVTRLSTNLGCWILTDTKLAGSVGGTAITGVWTTRTLNTVTTDGGSQISLTANQFTISSGNYLIDIVVPFNKTDQTRIRLQNITDNVTVLISINKTFQDNAYLLLNSYVALAAVKTFEIQYYATSSVNNTDLGIPDGITGNEIYTIVRILKI